jgi:hypothetical protein
MSGGSTNTVSQQTVPSWLQPYYTSALQTGQNLTSGSGPAYYPGNEVAPLNSVQEGAIGTQMQGLQQQENGFGTQQQGLNTLNQGVGLQNLGIGSILNASGSANATQGAEAANQYETSGALLNPASNPYLQQTFQQGANSVQNQVASEFAGSGRNIIGSLPVQSDEMNNLATQLYGGQYDTGLNATTQATALAPSIDAGLFQPGANVLNAAGQQINGGTSQLNAASGQMGAGQQLINSGNSLLSTGAGLQQQTQNNINQNVNAWNYAQQMPYNQLSYMSGLLGANASGFGSSSSNVSGVSNPWATAAGGGLLAAQYGPKIASLFSSTPATALTPSAENAVMYPALNDSYFTPAAATADSTSSDLLSLLGDSPT